MRQFKRFAALCMLLLLLLGTACSSKVDPSSPTGHLSTKNPVTVTLWHYYVGENLQALEAAVSEFNQTVGVEKGVIVEAVAIGSIADLEENITNSAMGVINARPMPQIFSSYPDKAMEIDALNMVIDLSPYFTEEERAKYIEGFLTDGVFEGNRLLVLPVVKSTELMYVNKTAWDAFAQAEGYTSESLRTWESIYDTARAYYQWVDAQTPDDRYDGKALTGFDSVANFIIIGSKQLGVNVIDNTAGENGAAVLDKAVLRRVFDTYVGGMSMGYFNAVGKFRSDDIKAGLLASYVGSSSSAAYFPTWIEENNAEQPIEFMAMPYPVLAGGDAYAIQQGAGMCVAKSTPAQQEGAVLFLKWFTDPTQNIRFAMTTGYLPVQRDAYLSEEFTQAMSTLAEGDEAQRNVASVYEIALEQIIEANTYAASPFPGSYEVRSILQSTLINAGEAAKAAADPMKAQGMDEEAILQALDMDSRFDGWISAIEAQLEEKGIAHETK